MKLSESERIRLGCYIRKLREQKHLSQEQLAADCDIGRQHLGALEAGKSEPSYVNVVSVFAALGVSLDAYFLPEISRERDDLDEILKKYWSFPQNIRAYLRSLISTAIEQADMLHVTKEEDGYM